MSAATIKKVTEVPEGGLKFQLGPGVKINSITPLATGNLVVKPASPIEGQTAETIAITEQLVGATFPGFGQTELPEGTTALPLLVVFASEGSPMFPVVIPGSSNVSQVATSENQELTLLALEQIYEALEQKLLPSSTAGVPKTPKNVPIGSAEPIVAAPTPAKLVRVQVEFDDTKVGQYVCIGDSTVTLANGEQLGPGDTYSEAVDNAAKLYCIGSVAGFKLRIKVF